MQTISKAVMRSQNAGTPLPTVYQAFEHNKVIFRKSGTSMIAAPPGRFKTGLALNLACKWAEEGLTVLYVAADSDQITIGKRCAGILTGKDIESDIEPVIKTGAFSDVLERLSNVHWEFRSLDVAGIEKRLQASEQMYGAPADVVFVDNLMNCTAGPGDWSGQIQMCRDLNDLAVAQRTHICILHHAKLPNEDHSFEPLGEREIQGQVTQFPRMVLSMNCYNDSMKVAVVKNTHGPQDPSARTWFPMYVDTSSFRIRGGL